MKAWTYWLVAGAVAAAGFPAAARAESEVDILLNKLVEKGVLNHVDAGEIRREISATKEARTTALAQEIVPDSARNWTWSGDLRLREEYRNRSIQSVSGAALPNPPDANRIRIRFRYGFEAKAAETLKVGARLATGSTTDPIATNQTFNTAFNHKAIVLDRAFAEYSPEVPGVEKLALAGGIIENPFWVADPLVWDDDLNFDGAAVKLRKNLGETATLFTNDGLFSLQTDTSENAALWSVQGGVILKPFADAEDELGRHLKLTGAIAYHDYQNVTSPFSENAAFAQAGGAGSTVPAAPSSSQLKGNTAGIADFNLLNPSVELASQYEEVPFSLFGDFVHNTAIADSGTNGFMIGLRLGKALIPFDPLKGWEGGYYFERLEPNATFGPFTDSDFGNGGTNHRGNVWWVRLATLKNSALQLKYFATQELKDTKNHADTFQADWMTRF